MSLYSQYIAERTNKSILETEHGFCVYSYPDEKTVYLEDIFVRKENRKSHAASYMADLVISMAKSKGCVKAIGSVVPTANNSTDSLKILLAYGMKLDSSASNFILFSKGII